MREMIKITLGLIAIFITAGIIMGLTYKVTSPIRYQAEKREKEEALKLMAREADTVAPVGTWKNHDKTFEYYEAKAGRKTVAHISSTAGKGYSSYIQMLVALDTDLRVRDVRILGHGETPGLGDQVEDPDFLGQFKGKSLQQIVLIKGETKENIQAISGATISSRAVTNGVKDAVQLLVDKYGAGVSVAVREQQSEHEVKK
jgi:electron transport complex protein RnfG